eukprot:4147635-Pleurochrysis_carterae.AAC.4
MMPKIHICRVMAVTSLVSNAVVIGNASICTRHGIVRLLSHRPAAQTRFAPHYAPPRTNKHTLKSLESNYT